MAVAKYDRENERVAIVTGPPRPFDHQVGARFVASHHKYEAAMAVLFDVGISLPVLGLREWLVAFLWPAEFLIEQGLEVAFLGHSCSHPMRHSDRGELNDRQYSLN
ncbi:MAG: hypothetical protein ACJAVZ_002792 [Afipia broomeae]